MTSPIPMPAGHAILASDIRAITPLGAYLGSDFNLPTSSTTLTNVTGLSVPVTASSVYVVELTLCYFLSAGVTEDIQVGASFPSGASLWMGSIGGTTGGVSGSTSTDVNLIYGLWTSGAVTFTAFGASTGGDTAMLRGVLAVGATAGTLQIMAAQNTSGVNTVTLQPPTHVLLSRFA